MRRFTLPARERIVAQRSIFGRFRFITDSIAELKKVSWPSREETKRLTTMVVIISVAMGIFLGFVDEVFSTVIDLLIF
ncbi:MAG: preprotein translocase subunit SecE [Chloroflexi bacterium]|nr:preprotein translocase subunit SecE [Chloroflexota bacterium]